MDLQKHEKPDTPRVRFKCYSALVELYRLKGDVVEMQRVVVKVFLDRPQSARRLAIRRIFDSSVEKKQESGRYIEFPIIAYLACDNPHEISLALKRYLRALSLENPHDLIGIPGLDRRVLASLFLKVCTLDVLDSLPSLDVEEKVETERLTLLDWVRKNAVSFAHLAENEVLRLTQQAELRDALQKIEGARVGLNLTGLREAEQEQFSDAYFRYTAVRELASAQSADEITKVLQALHRSEKKIIIIQAEALVGHQELAFNAFAAAFRTIRDAFVSSPHFGIDACLSGRIRHGILIEHIRRPLVEKKLAAKKDTPEAQEIEQFWRERLQSGNNVKLDSVMAILFKLTESVDTLAEGVRKIWIQCKTETRNPSGLFDYSFSDEQLRVILQNQIRGATTLETFLDSVFDVLLGRTRSSLSVVREQIASVLCKRLGDSVNRAISDVNRLPGNLTPLRAPLTAYLPETEQTCRQMERWFQGTDATLMEDVQFQLVADTAVGMFERLNPSSRNHHKTEVDSEYKVSGRYFTAFVLMLFFLLDNAARHSDIPKDRVLSLVKILAKSNLIIISVENQMSSAKAAAEAITKIHHKINAAKTALDPAKVVREGGSGFAKIVATIRYEFKQANPIIEATSEKNKITVSINCIAAGLTI